MQSLDSDIRWNDGSLAAYMRLPWSMQVFSGKIARDVLALTG